MDTGWQETIVDGKKMRLYVARPQAKKAPGLLVLQEAYGVNAHIRDVTERFAGLGYVAAAPELFHRTAPPGFESDYNFQQVKPHYEAVTEQTLTADLRVAHDWLSKDTQVEASRIAAVGFCMGGKAAFLANAVLPLTCAASYYGGGIAQTLLHQAPHQLGPILLFWGGKDANIGPEKAAPQPMRCGKRASLSSMWNSPRRSTGFSAMPARLTIPRPPNNPGRCCRNFSKRICEILNPAVSLPAQNLHRFPS